VQRGLLVDGGQDSGLLRFGGVEGSCQVQLQAFRNEVLQLDLSSEEVGGGPSLRYPVNAVLKSNLGSSRNAHTWVKIRPFLKSTYLPSMSPATAPSGARVPATLKVTLDGVRVLTSREVPWIG
jgi:hypothetical protein